MVAGFQTVERMSLPHGIFSIDVEDWLNLSGTGHEPPPSEWDQLESRIERNLRTSLELLATAEAPPQASSSAISPKGFRT
ncbi:MAG TPA: hypothetical protein VGG11_17300 [Xanthobacteraceae bacterium]|jgi:hypothetical protein